MLLTRAREDFVKSTDDYMYDLDQQIQEDGTTLQDDVDEEYVLYNDPVFNWCATRVAAKNQLSIFFQSDIESAKVGKTMLKQWRKLKDSGLDIDKDLTVLRMPESDTQMEVDAVL